MAPMLKFESATQFLKLRRLVTKVLDCIPPMVSICPHKVG